MGKQLKGFFILLVMASCVLVLVWQDQLLFALDRVLGPVETYTPHNLSLIQENIEDDLTPITVLLWTSFYGIEHWMGKSPLSCPSSQPKQSYTCIFATNKSELLDISEALLFFPRSMNFYRLPPVRHPWQKWIFYNTESPIHNALKRLIPLRKSFNLTMTYHKNSSVVNLYGRCRQIKDCDVSNTSALPQLNNFQTRKSVAWLVSHCHTQSRRDSYVKELKKYIDVDMYGACGKLKCNRKNCLHENLHKNYKFYLAFENSLCDDYMTEKPLKVLIDKINVIPIVLGNVKYEDHLPPGSYIDVRDYQSPRQLADYLQRLSTNQTMYLKFFEWRQCYECSPDAAAACDLCTYLHRNRRKKQIIDDIAKFWSRSHCQSPGTFYKKIMKVS